MLPVPAHRRPRGAVPMRVDEMVVDGELQTGRYVLQITLDWVAVSLVP
jgi:hypothetical protein